MKLNEKLVSPQSDYYIYSPSQTAKSMFFYPLYIGNAIYEPGYHLSRDSYDSFLLIYIRRGKMSLNLADCQCLATAGSFVLIDCYAPHTYGSQVGYECLWIHFDGPTARAWYQAVIAHMGHVISLADPHPAIE